MEAKQSTEIPDTDSQKAKLREIKNILLGQFRIREDQKIAAVEQPFMSMFGLEDGAPETFLFGVMHKEYVYEAPVKQFTRARFETEKMLVKMGRSLYLETAPKTAACLYKFLLFRPVILLLEEQKTDVAQAMVLRAYCGRSLLSVFSLMHAVSAFEKRLPEKVTRKDRKK